jgi:plastocyanin
MRVRALAVLSVLALLAAARPAAAGGGGQGACAGFMRGTAISMQDACFQGTAHIVDPGSTVTVTNHGRMPHDFTAADGSFASGLLQPGESFELTVDQRGVIPFYCTIHGSATGSGMAGVLFVGEAASSTDASRPAAAGSVLAPSTTMLADEEAMKTPAATAAVNDAVAPYLAAGALLIASIALVVAIALVRPPRRERGTAVRPEP